MSKKKNETTTIEAPKADRKAAAVIAKWKAKYLQLKALEPEVAALKDQVTSAVVGAGSNCLVSPVGTVALQTKSTVDWQALARSLLPEAKVEAAIQKFTSVSAPYVSAPREWTKESAAAESKRAA